MLSPHDILDGSPAAYRAERDRADELDALKDALRCAFQHWRLSNNIHLQDPNWSDWAGGQALRTQNERADGILEYLDTFYDKVEACL